MTSYWGAERPRLANGLPGWMASPAVALPGLYVSPLPAIQIGAAWLVEVIIDGSWEEREMMVPEVIKFLQSWAEGPEEALRAWFGREPPEARSAPAAEGPGEIITTTVASPEDLGL